MLHAQKLKDEQELTQGALPALKKKTESNTKDLELVQVKIDEELKKFGPQVEYLKE